MTDLHETAEYLRRMGEPESSVDYLLRRRAESDALNGMVGAIYEAHKPAALSLPQGFGFAIDPRDLTMEKAVAVMRPATNTGD